MNLRRVCCCARDRRLLSLKALMDFTSTTRPKASVFLARDRAMPQVCLVSLSGGTGGVLRP